MANAPITLRVAGFVQEQRADPATIEEEWIPFFAAADYPLRIIAQTSRFDLTTPMLRMRAEAGRLRRLETALEPIRRLVDGWDDPDARAAVLATLSTAVQEQVAAQQTAVNGNAPPVPTALVILDAYLEALPDAVQQTILAAVLAQSSALPTVMRWQQALDALDRLLWRRPWLQTYRAQYDRLNRHVALRGLRYSLVAWPHTVEHADDYATLVSRAFDTSATPDELPPLLHGMYTERSAWDPLQCYLAPDDPMLPAVALLTASGPLKGTWSTATLHKILRLDLDLAICLDVQPVSRTRVEFAADQKITAREAQQSRGEGSKDARARRELGAAYQLQEDLDTQAPHDLRVVVAVFGDTLAQLNAHVREVQNKAGTALPLMRVPGEQGALSRFFSLTRTPQINATTRPHRMVSHGVAVTVPFGLRKVDRTDGITWIYESSTPIMFDPFNDKRAAHAIILGKTGSGKTYAMNCWQQRMLAEGAQVVFYEPQGHSERLIRACGRGGQRFVLDTTQRLNVLDVVATRGERDEPPSMAVQTSHVITQLGVLLGASEASGEGDFNFSARPWTNVERGLLVAALGQLYAPWAHALDTVPTQQTPTLADLCDALTGLDLHEEIDATVMDGYRTTAKQLAAEIYMLLVRGESGAIFNGQTTIDWDFTSDATAFDFSQIPPGELLIFYYGQAFGSLNRMIRASKSRAYPVIATIDEFRYMAKVPTLARFAADATKTWRTFGAALWTADQDAHTYLGTEHSAPDEAMFSIWLNSTIKILFKQDAADAQRVQQKIQGLRRQHADTMTRAKRGQCLLVWEGDDPRQVSSEVFEGVVIANDAEDRVFAGS